MYLGGGKYEKHKECLWGNVNKKIALMSGAGNEWFML
jgi:hypothetical protein